MHSVKFYVCFRVIFMSFCLIGLYVIPSADNDIQNKETKEINGILELLLPQFLMTLIKLIY